MQPGKCLAVIILASLSVLLLLVGCAPPVYSVPQEQQAELFIPATLVVSPEPTIMLTTVAPVATPTPEVNCDPNLKYVSDVTIPDGTVVDPNSEVVKRWEVENTGSCDWDSRYALAFIDGSELGAAPKQKLHPARSGTKAVLQVIFTAPAEPGTYRSVWQAAGPDGDFFGDRFYMEFVVAEP
jgi:hypothetical protein